MASKRLDAPLARSLSRPEAIALLGLSVRHFARLEAEGVLPAVSRGRAGNRYDAFALVPAFLRYKDAKGAAETAREFKDRTQGELNALRLARERRDVLPREQVVREGAAVLTVIATKLHQLPGRLLRAGVIPLEGAAAVATEVDALQAELSGLTALEVLRDVPA